MQQKFISANQTYPQKPSEDLPAILEIAEFINFQQTGKKKEMHEMDVGERQAVMDEWVKWCSWYELNGNPKSLGFLVKFKLQEIYSTIKNSGNGAHNGGAKSAKNKETRDREYAGGF